MRLLIVVLPTEKPPLTMRSPFAVRLPAASVIKLVFSIQVAPFQKNVEPVAVPPIIVPVAFVQYVDVPLLTSVCPKLPITFVESYKAPLNCKFWIVDVAKVAKLVTVKLFAVIFPAKTSPVNVVVASVVLPFTTNELLNTASPLNKLSPFKVVPLIVTLVPDVNVPPDDPPDVVLVTAKKVPPPDTPSRPSLPSLPSLPAGPGTLIYLVM